MPRNQSESSQDRSDVALPRANPVAIVIAAWLVPGLGHFLLRRRVRGLAFAVLLVGSVAFGAYLHGRAPWNFGGPPLLFLATLGALGSGLPYLGLHVAGYQGDPTSWSWEYGGAFLLTAGLMNFLLVLDAWDICWGRERVAAETATADAGPTGAADAEEGEST
jgi:hypothetical protein